MGTVSTSVITSVIKEVDLCQAATKLNELGLLDERQFQKRHISARFNEEYKTGKPVMDIYCALASEFKMKERTVMKLVRAK